MVATLGIWLVGSALAGDFVAELGAGVLLPTLGSAGGVGFGAHLSPGYAIELSPDGLMPRVVPELKLAYQTGTAQFNLSDGMAGFMLGARADVVAWKGEAFSKKKRKNKKLTGRDGFKSYVSAGGLLHGGAYVDLGTGGDVRGALDLGLTSDFVTPQFEVGVHLTQSMFLPNASYGNVDGWLTLGLHVALPIQKAIEYASRVAN